MSEPVKLDMTVSPWWDRFRVAILVILTGKVEFRIKDNEVTYYE